MAAIDDFKANLIGGGARANQYRVTITEPTGITIGLDIRRTSFLVTASSLPAQTLADIPIPFRGRQIYIAGDRTFDEPWTTTFMNDTDFMIRNAMEAWSNGINDFADGTGVTVPTDYQADLTVQHLDRDDVVLKTYIFKNAWPTTVSAIELTNDQQEAIETFEVTWRYQYFTSSGVGGTGFVDIGL